MRESTRSVLDRQAFASYHYTEALRLTRAFERTHLDESLLIALFGKEHPEKRIAFERYILKAGAHATAAVQSLHAIPDILAHAMYFASGQNLRFEPIPPEKITINFVNRALVRDPDFQPLAPLLSSVPKGQPWNHLTALSNLSKHRTVVRAALNEDLSGLRKNFRELHFRECEYRDFLYPQVSVRELLEPEHLRLSTTRASPEVNHLVV